MKLSSKYFLTIGLFLIYVCGARPGFADEASILGGEMRSNGNDVYITPIELKKDRNPVSTCHKQKDGFQLEGLGFSYVKRNPCKSTVSPETLKD